MKIPRQTRKELTDEDSDPSALYEKKELRDLLNQALSSVSKRERYIVRHHFGFGAKELTIAEIAENLKLSKSRVGFLEKRAFEKIAERYPKLAHLRDRSEKIMKYGRFRINERVQVIGKGSDFLGYGRIVDFQKLFFSFPELYPEIKLESGRRICSQDLTIYKEKDSFRIAKRIMNDLFPKEKRK